ncbi:hypothetical protein HYS93_02965 [Candidatus Daviesbacteria bacterium]|nr:hypothetical protein [Candidatus Daviesbacteria bacterium]
MLSPYDLGNFLMVENCFKVNIDDLVSIVLKELKIRFLQSQVEVLGADVKFTYSKTKFNGKRYWFICPNCGRRVGTIYKHPTEDTFGCRICLNLRYRKQRFKGMMESFPYGK